MAELVPLPLPLLLRRAFLEYQREGKIFDLPKSKFFRGIPGIDFSVDFHGHRAATPLGPAAGPHGQLAQNIVLSWLGGSRIIELKTVQILDELKIPRPCIDIANVGYNVEWSQELKLEQSLGEYVGAAMFLEILKASKLLGGGFSPGDTVFDMSVGYNLEGIRSSRVRSWIESMKDASAVIDELRAGLTGPWARYRDLPFPERISDTISLSTFHGCPAAEIEGIVTFLLTELACNVCIKMNPTLLGRAEVEHLLHDVLGYREIQTSPEAFEKDLQFDEALDLVPRLQRVAQAHGKSLAVKFSNTLVVKNHKSFFSDESMYMSGPPLHVITMNLVKKFRENLKTSVPISFSAGLDAHNIAIAVAMNMVPVTTCTDLLRPGGYGRLIRYLENLGTKMREVGASTIPDYVKHYAGQEAALVAATTANPRYSWERNKGVPRKIGSKLWLYDCINCDKCVPVCPNDANFVYQTSATAISYDNFEMLPGGVRRVPGGVLQLATVHQLANYADACNDCGNCDVFCPEDGGPYVEKPRFFGSLETYRKYAGANGFYIDFTPAGQGPLSNVRGSDRSRDRQGAVCAIYGTIAGEAYTLTLDPPADRARFETQDAEIEIRLSDNQALSWKPKPGAAPSGIIDMLPYLKLKLLAESVGDPRRVHFANVAGLQEDISGHQESAL
ncbi:MAG: 4Fe-4S dicluster domain-containing protein [Bryobacteraceae bacterium]|jgi:putative selenate reductase